MDEKHDYLPSVRHGGSRRLVDGRVEWDVLEGETVNVWTYEGGDDFARDALAIAEEALADASDLLGVGDVQLEHLDLGRQLASGPLGEAQTPAGARQDDLGALVEKGKTVVCELKRTTLLIDLAEAEALKAKVEEQDYCAVGKCPCRQMARYIGRGCEHSLDNCLHFGSMARYMVEQGMAREISTEETLEILEQAIGINAMLRNTASATMLEGSSKVNVIPPRAKARVDDVRCPVTW